MLLWPHRNTDWLYMLDKVEQCFTEIASAINEEGEKLIIAAPDTSAVEGRLHNLDRTKIKFIKLMTNDTWARDVCPIVTTEDGMPAINDFKFNGWGLKFAANFDNLITSGLKKAGLFGDNKYHNYLSFVLEGGSIESDGNGTLLTTSQCLLSPNRNGGHTKEKIEATLREAFGAEQVLWLDFGYLEGDDTDSHIDTLARFAPGGNIIYVGTDNHKDCHYAELRKMKEQLATFRMATGEPYKLVELPLPHPIFDEDGNRLPATYANFLICNGFVLVPIYNQPDNDRTALETIGKVFEGYKIKGIDCTPLVQQHGSLHCVTMQFPENSIKL